MSNIVKKYCFNRISFCYGCFNNTELKDSTSFLFHSQSDNLIYVSTLNKLKIPLTKGFTPHVFYCIQYSGSSNVLEYNCMCGVCNREYFDKSKESFSFSKVTRGLVSITNWNILIDSTQSF